MTVPSAAAAAPIASIQPAVSVASTTGKAIGHERVDLTFGSPKGRGAWHKPRVIVYERRSDLYISRSRRKPRTACPNRGAPKTVMTASTAGQGRPERCASTIALLGCPTWRHVSFHHCQGFFVSALGQHFGVLGNEPVDILNAAARRFCHFLPAQAVAVDKRQEAVGQRFALQTFQFGRRLCSPRLPLENLIHACVAHAGHIPDGAPRQTERGDVANRRFASASRLPYNGRLRGCASNRVLVERRKEPLALRRQGFRRAAWWWKDSSFQRRCQGALSILMLDRQAPPALYRSHGKMQVPDRCGVPG